MGRPRSTTATTAMCVQTMRSSTLASATRGAVSSLTFKFQETDVVLNGPGIVILMKHDLGNSNVHLIRVIFIKVVVSNTDSKTAGRLSITAVTGCDNHIGGDKGSSAHEGATNSTSKESNLMRNSPGEASVPPTILPPPLERGVEGAFLEIFGAPAARATTAK